MSGSVLALEDPGERGYVDHGRVLHAGRVHLLRFRREHQLRARLRQRGAVPLERSRVPVEIVPGAELHRVDENADDDALGVFKRQLDQLHVATMQVAHRRHERHRSAFASPAGDVRAHCGDVVDRFQAILQKQCSGAG